MVWKIDRREAGQKRDMQSPKPREYDLVALGGTFEKLHIGHKALLTKALETGERVVIGLTTDRMARGTKSHAVASYDKRRSELIRLLGRMGARERVEIVPLDDPYGPTTVDPRIRALVVSLETASRLEEINRIRMSKGLKPLVPITVGMVLAEDRKPVSTTRIVQGEIDQKGRLLKPTVKKSG